MACVPGGAGRRVANPLRGVLALRPSRRRRPRIPLNPGVPVPIKGTVDSSAPALMSFSPESPAVVGQSPNRLMRVARGGTARLDRVAVGEDGDAPGNPPGGIASVRTAGSGRQVV